MKKSIVKSLKSDKINKFKNTLKWEENLVWIVCLNAFPKVQCMLHIGIASVSVLIIITSVCACINNNKHGKPECRYKINNLIMIKVPISKK